MQNNKDTAALSTPLKKVISVELVGALHKGNPQNWASMILAVLTWWVFNQHVGDWPDILWLTTSLGVAVARIFEIHLFQKYSKKQGTARQWGIARVSLSLLAVVVWSTLTFWFDLNSPIELTLFAILVLSVVTTSASVSLGAWPLSTPLIGTIIFLPLLVKLSSEPANAAAPIIITLSGFVVLLGGISYQLSRIIRDSALRKHSTGQLAKKLKTNHQQLQVQLQARRYDQAVFTQGPVVAFRCFAEKGWPIQHISPNSERLALPTETIIREQWPLSKIIYPEDMQKLLQAIKPDKSGHMRPIGMDLRLLTGAGLPVWAHLYVMPMVNDQLEVISYNGYFLDIASRRRAEDALQREKERAEVTLKSIGDAVLTVNSQGNIDYMNAVAETLTGYSLDKVQGEPASKILSLTDEHDQSMAPPTDHCLQNPDRFETSHNAVLHRPDGESFDVALTSSPIQLSNGTLLGAVLVMHDMTELRSLSRELNYFATYDQLTNLINRREFEKHLEDALANMPGDHGRHVLAYIDLDRFKTVNDISGHHAGDALLQRVANVFKMQLRDEDILARIGGDEFGLLMKNIGLVEAMKVSRQLVDSVVEARFVWEERTFTIGASIGLTAIDDPEQKSRDLLIAADMACYSAKAAGRNRVHIYQADDTEMRQQHNEVQTISDINSALQENRLLLVKQPISPTVPSEQDDKLEHYELLLRMRTRDGKVITAANFLEAAERFNLMSTIDRWVVRTALETLVSNKATPDNTLCAINLSGESLTDHSFGDELHRQLTASTIDGRCLCFEITETVAISNLDAASAFMARMRAFGCYFALDDFGSGVSSFAYLKHLPVDILKIDGVFVKDLLDDPVDSAMVAAINEVGHTLGMKTVAEYVQSDAIRKALQPLGVDFVQGEAVGQAVPFALTQDGNNTAN